MCEYCFDLNGLTNSEAKKRLDATVKIHEDSVERRQREIFALRSLAIRQNLHVKATLEPNEPFIHDEGL